MKIISRFALVIAFLPLLSLAADKATYDPVAVTMKLRGSEDNRREAVRLVLENSAQADAATMFIASLNANSLGQLEDAGFLFYAAQMRAVFDMKRFKGGNTPGGVGAAFGALRNQIGEVINPAIVRNPKVYAKIVERLENWDMTTPKDYKPGWDTQGQVPGVEKAAVVREIKEGPLKGMRPMAKLLQDPEYFAAFHTYQDFNLATYKEQQEPDRIAQKNAAEETILRIEKQKRFSVLSEILGPKGK